MTFLKKAKVKAFTLVEMLVVLLIISVLLLLFVPNLTKQKEATEKLLTILPKKYIKRRIQLKQKLKLLNTIL